MIVLLYTGADINVCSFSQIDHFCILVFAGFVFGYADGMQISANPIRNVIRKNTATKYLVCSLHVFIYMAGLGC